MEVVWSGEDGRRRSLQAEYVGPAGENLEIWEARATVPLTADDSSPGDVHFVLHGRIAGCDYWNPPDQLGAMEINADSGILIGDQFPLLNVAPQRLLHADQQFYPVTIAVREDIQPDKVSIRWSTDRWRTFADTPAFLWR